MACIPPHGVFYLVASGTFYQTSSQALLGVGTLNPKIEPNQTELK
jgi:hypothetical protein